MLAGWAAFALAVLLAACTPPAGGQSDTTHPVATAPARATTAPAAPAGAGGTPALPAMPALASPTAAPMAVSAATPTPNPLAGILFSTSGWKTDFSRHTVPLSEISSGGPPRDGIPPIDRPVLTAVRTIDWLNDAEPVVAVELSGEARAYPLQILIWHEIVNDDFGGTPVAVTFCPLCNTAIAFDRRVPGQGTLRFGTTGNLRHSDLVMWDDRTESWWQQITGEAIVGSLAGTRLEPIPAQIVGFGQFKQAHPNGAVLARETGYTRNYGQNPYVGYDNVDSSPFLYDGPADGRLRPMERVVTVSLDGADVAYPFSVLAERRVIHDTVGRTPVVVLFARGALSSLDRGQMSSSRDIGATGVFKPRVGDRSLTFAAASDGFRDAETGSTWDILGRATAGPLAGQRLEPVVSGTHFWFAWAAFKPQTTVRREP
ncbi:MAG: DUF3179 domain-containing protein [Chloroflexi bacterium]|nr:DUF3179 domain-containing protein [Chloroflexota bacterium]